MLRGEEMTLTLYILLWIALALYIPLLDAENDVNFVILVDGSMV
jgi:hypothetical protein